LEDPDSAKSLDPDPDLIGSVDLDLDQDSTQDKLIPKERKKSRKFQLKSSLEGWMLLLEPERSFQGLKRIWCMAYKKEPRNLIFCFIFCHKKTSVLDPDRRIRIQKLSGSQFLIRIQ
jgi:hypothetical protein